VFRNPRKQFSWKKPFVSIVFTIEPELPQEIIPTEVDLRPMAGHLTIFGLWPMFSQLIGIFYRLVVEYRQIDAILQNVKELAQTPRAQILPSNTSPRLLTPDAFLPPTKEITLASNISPLASSSSSKKKSSKNKNKKKTILKAFLDSLDNSYNEDEDFEATIDLQRELFGNSRFITQDYYPGLEDL
jgi:hypothetical protein